jgi:hypothetical protein
MHQTSTACFKINGYFMLLFLDVVNYLLLPCHVFAGNKTTNTVSYYSQPYLCGLVSS